LQPIDQPGLSLHSCPFAGIVMNLFAAQDNLKRNPKRSISGTGDMKAARTMACESRERERHTRADQNPGHGSAAVDAEKARGRFKRRLAAAIIGDFPSAVRLVRDHFPRHIKELPGDQLFRFGVAFYQASDLEKARCCLELAAAEESSWQHKALLLLSYAYEEEGDAPQAIAIIWDLLERRPPKIFRRQAMKRLIQLQEQCHRQRAKP
jgi:tetratricopeptide (TPR) repeat protein